eukprot:TRINITY_DN7440_c0_g1_i1.p3 TRINITY_DN7440_c0_g1~~TRINITY_DN7440_c0_g1_i1.p3  ORF type:complete len:108 (-),score=22.97 TRINITY_DN7440_c0_g1_i1:162-485(-)
MSLFRVARASQAADSIFERTHKAQQLTCEYGPILAILFLYIHFQTKLTGQPITLVHKVSIGGAVVGRYLFVLGCLLNSMKKSSPLRFYGATITYIAFLACIISAALL